VRRLIVNADDLGLTRGVNRGIIEAHQNGIVSSSTLMATGAAFEDAAQLAATHPKLSVGCHIVLIDGFPILPARQVSSLIDKNQKDRFYYDLPRFAFRALGGRFSADQIEAEAAAQIRKLQASGIEVSHIDTHKHTHVFPQVLSPLLRAAKACGVRAIRNPFEPLGLSSFFSAHPRLWPRYIEVNLLRSFTPMFRSAIQKMGILSPQGTFGVGYTGIMNAGRLGMLLSKMRNETWELVCHPGYNDSDLQAIRTRLLDSRVEELNLLTAPATRKILSDTGIQVISYREL